MTRSNLFNISIFALILGAAAPAQWGSLSEPNAPRQGRPESQSRSAEPFRFQSHDDQGRVVTGQCSAEGGCTGVLRRTRAALAGHVGGPVSFVSVFSTRSGDAAQATFTNETVPVRGIVMVQVKEGIAQVQAVMDRADRAATTLGDLVARLPGQGARRRAPRMRPVSIPDGSGSLQIPEGWQMAGQRGMVDVGGPEGQACAFGIHFQVSTPESAGSYHQTLVQLGMSPTQIRQAMPITAPYRGPVQAFVDVTPQFMRTMGAEVVSLRVLETKEMQDMAGPSAYILAEGTVRRGGRDFPMRSLVHVYTSPIGGGQWLYYYSGVSAPPKIFERDFATLMACWNSFKVSGRELRRRHESAMKDMKETFAMYRSSTKLADESNERSHKAFTHVLRGTWPVENTQTGTRHQAWTSSPGQIVNALNAHAGHQQWRVIPMSQL